MKVKQKVEKEEEEGQKRGWSAREGARGLCKGEGERRGHGRRGGGREEKRLICTY